MNRRQKIIVSITGIFIILLALVGLTYAYFLTRITGNENDKSISVTTANLELLYGDGTTTILEPDTALIPSSTEVGTKDFTVTNNGEDTSYTVLIEDTVTKYASAGSYKDENGNIVTYTANQPTNFISNDFRYTLTCTITSTDATRNGKSCDGVSEQKLFPINGGVIASNNIVKGDIHTYELKFWYIDTGINQSKDMNKTYNAKVNIVDIRRENPYATDTKSLAYNIINNSLLKTNGTELRNTPLTTPVVEISGADEKVLSVTQDNLGTSYYYRGSVQDNYVLFNNMCWRIVRIEGDGSVKLILAGEVSEGSTDCNAVTSGSGLITDGELVTYGYKTITGLNGNTWCMADYENDGKTATNLAGNSETSLKEALDTWFESKFTSEGVLTTAGNKLKNDEWCLGGNYNYKYDKTTGTLMSDLDLANQYKTEGDYTWYYSSARRIKITKTTDLTCGDSEDSITSRIGSITTDDITLAGGSEFGRSQQYYLIDNLEFTNTTLSLASFYWGSDLSFVVSRSGFDLTEMTDTDLYGSARPAITLIPDTKITKGEGTKTDPYIIDLS